MEDLAFKSTFVKMIITPGTTLEAFKEALDKASREDLILLQQELSAVARVPAKHQAVLLNHLFTFLPLIEAKALELMDCRSELTRRLMSTFEPISDKEIYEYMEAADEKELDYLRSDVNVMVYSMNLDERITILLLEKIGPYFDKIGFSYAQ